MLCAGETRFASKFLMAGRAVWCYGDLLSVVGSTIFKKKVAAFKSKPKREAAYAIR